MHIAGGTDGNERLTTLTGAILIVLLLVIGVTILRMRQLIDVHLFVGWLLLGPVLLKLASTGYRFVRYYTHNAAYRAKGPPELALRLIAPVVVLSTMAVFVSGVVLMFQGAGHRDPWLEIHKVSFIIWAVFTAVHVVGHLPRVAALLAPGLKLPQIDGVSPSLIGPWSAEQAEQAEIRPGLISDVSVPGRAARLIALASVLVGGAVLAIVLIPDFSSWSSHLAFAHPH
jgi:hypothetical protein